jgi:hypothetical protein
MPKKEESIKSFADDPLFQEVLAEGLAIQDRFSAAPVYARSGKGYLKSAGVAELAEIKRGRKPGRHPVGE